jgi:hypothetical protein
MRKLIFFLIVLAVMLPGCGDSNEDYLYDVKVINNTDSTITVKYDPETWGLDEVYLFKTSIVSGDFQTIQWYSDESISDTVEVEYAGTKKVFTVFKTDMLVVSSSLFTN